MKSWVVVIAAVMFGLPWTAVTFVPGDGGMAACFILFFVVNPLVSCGAGIVAGLEPKRRWFLPLWNAVAFLLGSWTVFSWGNPDFYGYAAAYFAISLLSMLAAMAVRIVRRQLNNQ